MNIPCLHVPLTHYTAFICAIPKQRLTRSLLLLGLYSSCGSAVFSTTNRCEARQKMTLITKTEQFTTSHNVFAKAAQHTRAFYLQWREGKVTKCPTRAHVSGRVITIFESDRRMCFRIGNTFCSDAVTFCSCIILKDALDVLCEVNLVKKSDFVFKGFPIYRDTIVTGVL